MLAARPDLSPAGLGATSLLVEVIEGGHATPGAPPPSSSDLSDLDNPDACLAAAKEPRRLAAGPLPELLFAYHGTRGDTGAVREAHDVIGVAAAVVEERLRVEWI